MKRTEKKAETVSFPETVPEMEGKPKRGRKPRATKKQETEVAPVNEIAAEEESASEPESTTESEPEPTPAVNPAAVQIVESPLKLMKQEFQKRAQVIKEQMHNIQNAFITIGFQLHWICNNNMYRVLNYKNVYEYAKKEYGIKKTTCCNFISIIENYADRDENGEVIESISSCYRNYSAGQLVAMLGMPDEMKQQVSPDMSVRAIKRLKQGEPESPAEKIVPVKEAAVQGKGPKPKGPRPAPDTQWHAIYGLSNFAAYCIMIGEINKKRQAMRDGNPP